MADVQRVLLPKELLYNKYYKLPQNVQCTSIATNALNNSVGAGEKLEFDFVSRGKVVPNTIWMEYELVISGQTNPGALIRGIPFYAPLSGSRILIGSQGFDDQQSYNVTCSALVDYKMTAVQKLAHARNLGIDGTQSVVYGGSILATGVGMDLAGPLPNMLSNASNQIPLAWMPQVRLQLTLAQLTDFTVALGAGTAPTSYLVRNAVLHYDIIEYGEDYDREILATMLDENGKLNIKTMSYATSGQVISIGSSGNLEYVFNTRYGSIKSLFAFFPPSNANSIWQQFESFDPTASSGEISFTVAGNRYPQRPLSTAINKSPFVMELLYALNGSQHPFSSTFSNSYNGWILNNNGTSANGTTYPVLYGTFVFGQNVERLSTNDALLSGISTQSSPITVNLNFSTMTAGAQSVRLTVMYDAIIQIDPMSRTVTVIQ